MTGQSGGVRAALRSALGWDAPLHSRRAPRWSWLLIAVMVLGVIAPVIVAAVSGALTIPHNDSWALSRIASTFTHSGHLRLVGWNDMFLVGQIVALAPFGSSVMLQDLGIALTAAVALYAVYRVAGLSLPRLPSVLVAGTVALIPGWASLTTSYMTDVPAFCGALLTMLVGHAAIGRDSRALFVVALLVGVWAFTIREPAIAGLVGLVAYAVAASSHGPRVSRRFVIVASSLVLVALVGIRHWRQTLPMGQNPPVSLNPAAVVQAAIESLPFGWVTLGFLILPVTLLYVHPRTWSRRGWIGAGLSGVVVLLACRHGVQPFGNHPAPFIGNYMTFNGEYHYVRAFDHPVIAQWIWVSLAVVGALGAVLAGGAIVEGWRRVDPMVRSFTLCSGAVTVVVATVGGVLYDRYMLVLIPGLASAVGLSSGEAEPAIRRVSVRAVLASSAALGVGVIALAMFLNANASDRARWDAAAHLAAAGVPADKIDAGLEWDGWHAEAGVIEWNNWSAGAWSLFHPDISACFVVVQDQDPAPAGATLRGHFSYRTFGLFGASDLRIYATGVAGCADPAGV